MAKVEARTNPDHKDNSLREFRRLCANIADTPGTWYTAVSAVRGL